MGGKRALADFDLEARRRAIRLGPAQRHVALMSLVSATRAGGRLSTRVERGSCTAIFVHSSEFGSMTGVRNTTG